MFVYSLFGKNHARSPQSLRDSHIWCTLTLPQSSWVVQLFLSHCKVTLLCMVALHRGANFMLENPLQSLAPALHATVFHSCKSQEKKHKFRDWFTNWNGLFERIYGWAHSARSTSTHGFASSSRSAATRNKWPGLECMVPRPGSLLNWWVRQRKFNVFIGLHFIVLQLYH